MGVALWQTANRDMIPVGHSTHTFFPLNPWMKGDEFTLTLTHPSGIYGCGASLNSNIMSRPGNCQEVQDICDDKTATAAVHLDPDHQPRDKSISTQCNYSICRLAREHAAMGRQVHFFLLFKNLIWNSVTIWEMKGGELSIPGPLNNRVKIYNFIRKLIVDLYRDQFGICASLWISCSSFMFWLKEGEQAMQFGTNVSIHNSSPAFPSVAAYV